MQIFNRSIIESIIVVILCIIFCSISKKIVRKIFGIRSSLIPEKRQKTIVNLITNIVRAFIVVISVTIILEEFGVDTKSFIASLGVFSLVLGLALQDILKDIIAGVSITFEGLFNIGDWIKIGDFKGEVITTGLRTTKIKAYTGEIKIISNRNILDLINYSMDKTTSIIDVEVAYESDLDKVEEILINLCTELKKKKVVKEMEFLGLETLELNGLKYRLIIKSNYSDSFVLGRNIRKEIVTTFNKNKITIPYNQVVIHNELQTK